MLYNYACIVLDAWKIPYSSEFNKFYGSICIIPDVDDGLKCVAGKSDSCVM